ncbi:helix-turn-helix domain-containing protein [Methylobacterium sp. J-070]|uniref:helix-turn-helix domain-containing protein n=1 Tax=Methylobacterium sp. J-070 TaxID=2836650 RepID=UPI001FB9872E|nr:AraC family transcriptional regulator [Methylobacterium sp. J-070]MCJ2050270.1 AraC family transcriptional regulator [Methylobacterium sp. J-070]
MISDRTVIALTLRGTSEAVIHRRGNGERQSATAVTGTFWLCPEGVAEDSIRITADIPEMLHIYLPRNPFTQLSQEDSYPDLDATTISYHAGAYDTLIAEIGHIIASELTRETSSGKLLVEAAGVTLAAFLAHAYSCIDLPYGCHAQAIHALDKKRLDRVREFIDANLDNDISVDELAGAACLSKFHFIRAFKAATGISPHSYVSHLRLERAKILLRLGQMSLQDIAVTCRFSSQSNFTKAFRRVVGVSPGQYRQRRDNH